MGSTNKDYVIKEMEDSGKGNKLLENYLLSEPEEKVKLLGIFKRLQEKQKIIGRKRAKV